GPPAAVLLRPGGAIGIEHDDTHATAVPALLRGDGRYDRVEEHRDLAGRPRWASASRRADGTHAETARAWQTDSS
ncbi:peptide chain release factor N(5)-glutamine methyltransferase, partial [Micromonospora chalcea]|nr:peptide chain release factor N(5)-glutamine methyltransferase [Micromonospora chalcea]